MQKTAIYFYLTTLCCIAISIFLLIPTVHAAPGPASAIKSESKIGDYKLHIPVGTATEISKADFVSGRAVPVYISLLYQWFVGFTLILGVIALMAGGVVWILAGGNKGSVDKAKGIIKNSLVGIFLALGSYLFLWTISPNLVQLKPLPLKKVDTISYNLEEAKKREAAIKSCNDICQDAARKSSVNTTGSGVVAACIKGSSTVKTPELTEVCVEEYGITCKCEFITRKIGDKNCLTPGLECPTDAYCDPLKNECVAKKGENMPCEKDIECQNGFSCPKDTKKCTADSITNDDGVCCYLGSRHLNPEDKYGGEESVATAEKYTYRQCQEKGSHYPSGTAAHNRYFFWCKTDNVSLCGNKKSTPGGGTIWDSTVLGSLQKTKAYICYLFRPGTAPQQISEGSQSIRAE